MNKLDEVKKINKKKSLPLKHLIQIQNLNLSKINFNFLTDLLKNSKDIHGIYALDCVFSETSLEAFKNDEIKSRYMEKGGLKDDIKEINDVAWRILPPKISQEEFEKLMVKEMVEKEGVGLKEKVPELEIYI